MNHLGHRALTGQLAEDLGWLEEHSRRRGLGDAVLQAAAAPDRAIAVSELRLAAALVRNCIGPYLNDQGPAPLHIAVVGGAGTGKSTVANLLSGAPAAETNPQAGFTRHPVVYAAGAGPLKWTGHDGFLRPLQRAPQESPASLDADVYQVRRVPSDPTSYDLLKDFVVWDCPDMTTWAAAGAAGPEGVRSPGYLTRLLEVAALADVVVYVASDERYNDEVPTQFLRVLLAANKPAICVLTKMHEADAARLVEHFKQEVAKALPQGIVDVLAIPFLTPEQLADPARKANAYRIPLLNQLAVLGHSPAAARKRTVQGALHFLASARERLLAVARHDVEALDGWRGLVLTGQVDFDQRYRREYLTSEKYRGFDEALVRLIDLLELPGVGKVVSGTLWVLRTPYRLVKGLLGRAMSRPDAPTLPEQPILDEALGGWLDMLRKEAARRAATHPLWAHLAQGFAHGNLADLARDRYQQGYRGYQMALAEETDRTARAIYEQLEKNPAVLNTLRGSKFAIDAAAIGGALVTGGVGWSDLVLVPLAASVTHQLVELLGRQYVDSQRELTRQRQQALLSQYISGPLAEWLAQWPATGGSAFERLQLALRRIPDALAQVQKAVENKP